MGTHPIFESDFDCLTDAWWVAGKTLVVVRKVRAMTRIGPALNQPMSKKKAKEVQLQKRNQKRKNQKKILNVITRPERSVIVHDLDHTRAKRNLEKSQKIEKSLIDIVTQVQIASRIGHVTGSDRGHIQNDPNHVIVLNVSAI